MDRIPLINPKLIKVVSPQEDRASTPVLRAEVVSSKPIKADLKQSETQRQADPKNKTASDSDSNNKNSSQKEELRYKVVLKIGKQELETISTENLKKGSQLDVKVTPGPELKIIANSLDKSNTSIKGTASNVQAPAQAAMQQLLADRIPNIQSQGLAKLIDQLGQLITIRKSPVTPATTEKILTKALPVDSHSGTNISVNNAEKNTLSTKQALANLVYQSLSKQAPAKHLAGDVKMAITPNSTDITTADSTPPAIKKSTTQVSIPIQQVKDWLQKLPSSSDISNSIGLKNAFNNSGVRAEIQLSQLAQQFATLSKRAQHLPSQNSAEEKSTNTIFQQLQKIQQNIFSKSPEPLANTNLGNIVKNTAQTLENSSQQLLASLKKNLLNNKTDTASAPAGVKVSQATSNTATLNVSTINPTTTTTTTTTTNNWQNPLLNSQAYSTLNELMNDPLLKNPSSNNKFAISQMLNQLTGPADSHVQIPLNWPERSGNDAVLIRTLQNLLGHIEREQGAQLQQSDNNLANPNLTSSQNQQWLPLLIHHQQQLQLIEFFINKEEKKNAQGEKKNHWFINLHFDLPLLGELGIEISMFDNECTTTFWSESTSTLNRLSNHVQPLRQRLTEQGIIVSDVQSRHGTLAKRKHNIQQRLIDIET